ncbi:MAG: Vps62-related protein [Gaiellaceae bacterium]
MRTALLLVAAVICSLAGEIAAASTPTNAQLLARYAPILVLHSDERFHPVPVDGYLADANLVAGHYDQRLCKSIDGTAALDCYAAADAAHGEPSAVYGAVFRRGNRITLEYWLFYPFDLYSPTVPPGEIWQDHEADWEAVTVLLDAQRKPLLVATSRHCGGARRDWSRVTRRGTRPVIYAALGSHANYFVPGRIQLERRCWPSVALAVFRAYKAPLVDHVSAGRTIADAQVIPITATSPSWMTFAGRWGETQYVHFPNTTPFAYGLGPSGPAFHALWRQPVSTILSWPRG